MKPSHSLRTVLVVAPALLAGCLSNHHAPPTVETPSTWKEASATTDLGADANASPAVHTLPVAWWRIFGDQELNALEAQVVNANQDLQRALARVTEARALARLGAADLVPSLSAGSDYARSRASANQPNPGGLDRETGSYRTGFDLAYEIDLWGRNRQGANAARAAAYAEENDFHAALLTLTADTARHYHELRALDAERVVIESTLAYRRDAVRLQTTRHQAGLINETDVARARTEVATIEAELHAVTRHRARLEHALAVLCGQSAGSFTIAPDPRQVPPPVIPVGLPSELLQRRPDIAAAERRLEAAGAGIAMAKADFFPRLSLTGSAGFASTDLNNLTDGSSGTWSFGPRVHLPIFDGGRNRANLNAAEARYEQSAAAYRGTVLNAFREVEDALADLNSLAREGEAVQRGLLAARDTAALASKRYERGLSNYLDVVDAQRDVFQAERHTAQLRGQQSTTTILLTKALGGGWQRTDVFAAQ